MIIKLLNMKKQRNVPVLHQVMQRQNQYETHLIKLQQIQAERKVSLARKSLFEKTILLEHIKNQKHNNFIQKLSKQSMRINQENIKFVDKLNRAKDSISSRSKRSSLSQSSLTYSIKKSKEKQITKQNSRIFNKLNNSCPYVNTQKINEQYQKIKKIGNRLRKYDNSCELKTKKYMRTTTLSITTNLRFSAPHKQRTLKPKITHFYNKEDILKNKIQNRGIPSAKILLRELQNRKISSEQKYYEFFNTQVNPQMEHH